MSGDEAHLAQGLCELRGKGEKEQQDKNKNLKEWQERELRQRPRFNNSLMRGSGSSL